MALAKDSNGQLMPIPTLGLARQLAVGATSAQSAALTSGTTAVRLVATTEVYFALGANPTASAATYFLPAMTEAFYGVGEGFRVAAVQASAAGTLHIAEVA